MDKRYVVSATDNPFGELVDACYYGSAEEAIVQWCKFSESYPTSVTHH